MESQEDAEMETAVRVFAHYLGVDLDTESDLIPAVRDAFYNLPEDWDIGIAQDDQAGIPFFTNSITGVSDWKHPREEMCIQAVKAARAEKEEREEERRRNRNKRDRDQQVRGRESDQNRRNNNSGRNAMPEVSEVVAMEDIVEDLEDIPSNQSGGAANRQQSQSARGRSASPTQKQIQEVKSRSASSNAYKGGFGMSSDDFLDEDEHVPADRRTSGGNHNTSQQQRSAVDNSLSPPLFKEMRSQNQAAAADYDSDDARNMRSKQGTTSTSLVTSHGTGLVDGAVSSGWASALGATQSSTDMDRDRERDRERDGARSVSNQRGRNSNEVEEHRGGGVSRGGRGGGGARGDDRWDRGGRGGGGGGGDAGDGRGRDQYRDGSRERDRDGGGRDTREARERDLRGSRDDRGDEGRFGGRGRGDGRGGGGGSERGASNQRGSVAFQASTSTTAVSVSNHVSDRERELKAEIDKYQVDVHKLSDDNLELAEKLALQRTKHANELSTLREDVSRLELRLAEERRERKVIEEQLTHAHAEHHSKARDLEDVHEIRLREAVRKARTDTEEEYREKVRTAERRSIEELDAVRAELVQLKRKCEEAQREADSAKRKISLSKADGRLEAQAEVDALRASLREAEETDRKQSLEMRRLREESAGVQGRLVGALQAVQLANAECDALRATAHTAVHDEQTHSGAVQAAMQRIQILDAECAQAKAENIILRREKEASALEIRKLRGTADFSGDRLNSTESEARRIKAQAQAETGRLQSRVTELEALTSVLRGQLDQAASHEAQAVREVSRECDTLDSEVQRLRDRLADREVKEEAFTTRIKTLEREAIRLQEILFKKDRQIRDEQEGKEGIQAQIESIRRGYESEIEDMKNILTKQKQANAELITHQRREAERLEQEISEKVPELIENAVSRAEAQWAAKHAKEVTDLKLQYEHQRDKLRAENHDLQTLFSEKEARQRLQNTEEKIELERLRQNNKITQRRNEDLEEQVLELRRQLRVSTNNSHYFGTPATSGAGASALLNRSGTGRHPPGRFPNTSSSNTFSFHVNPHHNNISGGYNGGRMSLDFSQALDQSFDNVRHSTGNPVPPPPPQYDARLDNNSNYNDENVYYDAQMQNSSMALQAGEDALMSHTVSFINDQLAFMKKQISSTLTAGNTSTGDNGFTAVANHRRNGHSSHSTYSASEESALVGADDAIDAINASVLGLPPTTTSTSTSTAARTPATFATSNSSSRSATVPVPSSILSQHHSHNNHQSSHSGAHHHHHHVKFSPEALFHSPQHPSSAKTATAAENKRHPTEEPTSRPARQSDTAEYETQRQHQDQGQEQGEGQVKILDEHRSTHIDGGRSSGAAPLPDPPLSRGNANVRDAYADTSMLSDYSMNNFSTSYLDNPTSVNSTYNTYSSRASGARGGGGGGAGGGGGSYGIHSSGLGNADFSAISDGGYHEGYWRAKYQRTSKQ